MDFYSLAKEFVCAIIAAALSLTSSVVEKMLPRRREWQEKIALLEAQFRALAAGAAAPPAGPRDATARPATDGAPRAPDTAASGVTAADLQGLVDGYGKLLEFVQHVKLRGLMLDPEFCQKVEREWSVKTLLSYMVSAENSLKQQASEAHDAAIDLLAVQQRK